DPFLAACIKAELFKLAARGKTIAAKAGAQELATVKRDLHLPFSQNVVNDAVDPAAVVGITRQGHARRRVLHSAAQTRTLLEIARLDKHESFLRRLGRKQLDRFGQLLLASGV